MKISVWLFVIRFFLSFSLSLFLFLILLSLSLGCIACNMAASELNGIARNACRRSYHNISIVYSSFFPFFSSKHARYFTLRFMQIPFGSFYDPNNCRIFSLSLSVSLFFLSFKSRIGSLVLDEDEVCGESRSGGFMGLWNERNLCWNI